MATLMSHLSPSVTPIPKASVPLDPTELAWEPDQSWKDQLRERIESSLQSMVKEAKDNLTKKLKERVVNETQRNELTEEYNRAMHNIRMACEEQFNSELEQERQQRRWALGEHVDDAKFEAMKRQQQAILDRIKREREADKPTEPIVDISGFAAAVASEEVSASSGDRPPQRNGAAAVDVPTLSADTDRGAYFPRPLRRDTDDATATGALRPQSQARSTWTNDVSMPPLSRAEKRDTQLPSPFPFVHQVPSAYTVDEPEDMIKTARLTPDPSDSMRRDSLRRKASITAQRPSIPEIWKPTITPEEDAAMSRPYHVTRRGSTTSLASNTYRSPVTPTAPERPSEAAQSDVASHIERERAGFAVVDKQWSGITRAREKERQTQLAAEPRISSASAAANVEERGPILVPPMSTPSPISPSSATGGAPYQRSVPADSSQWHSSPPPSASASRSRPINIGKPYSADDSRATQPSPTSRVWVSPPSSSSSRSPYESRFDIPSQGQSQSHSLSPHPYSQDEAPRSWQSSNLRTRMSSQDIRYGYGHPETAVRGQTVHTYHENWEEEDSGEFEEGDEVEDGGVSIEEVERRKEEARRKEEEARRKEEHARWMEEEARRKQEEAQQKEEEARRKEEDARKKEEEARRKEEAARQKEEETRRKEEEIKRREQEVKRREEELERREAEARRKEEESQRAQQEEFRRREEDIRRRAEERKRQDSMGNSSDGSRPNSSQQTSPTAASPWSTPNRSANSSSSPTADRGSSGSNRSSATGSSWSSASASASTRPTSTASSQQSTPKSTSIPSAAKAAPGMAKSASGTSSHSHAAGSSTYTQSPLSEAEFTRRQAEQAAEREQKFRQEQARLAMQEQERLAKSGKIMSKQEVIKLFEFHKAQWDGLQNLGALGWDDFPWPMFKRPSGPADLATPAISAYMLSPLHPTDKATKERIKDNIRRWHPDRFETQLLIKVKESEREKVREGAGLVVRVLNDLLRSGTHDVFS